MHRIIHTSLLEIPTRAANQNRMAGTRSGLDHPQLFCMSDGSFVADLTTVLRVGRVVRCRPGCCRNCSRIIEEFVAALKTFIFQIVVDHLLFLIVSSSLSEPCMSHTQHGTIPLDCSYPHYCYVLIVLVPSSSTR